DHEPLSRVEHRHRSRDARLEDRRVRVAQLEVVDVAAELPLESTALAATEQVPLLEPEEAAQAGPLADRCTEVDVAGATLGDAEGDVDVAVLARGDVGNRHRLLEEAEVGDVVPRTDQPLAIEQFTGHDDDRLADH